MNLGQEEARRLLDEMMEHTGLSLTALARGAGMAHTTLTRFYNKEDVKHTLKLSTAQKLAVAHGMKLSLSIERESQSGRAKGGRR